MEREAYRAMAEIEGRHWWFVGRRKIISSLIADRIAPRAHSRVLEAGCGTGGNLSMLRQFGELCAFEYDDDARAWAASHSGLDVLSGSLPEGIGHVSGPFDLIALFDVLEHIEQDSKAMKALAKKLAPGGRIILTVPALQFLWSRHDAMHHHFRRYSRSGLRSVIEQSGFKVEYITYFNSILLPAAVMERLRNRLRKTAPGIDVCPPRLLNKLLTTIFAFESVLLRHMRLPIGLSLCAICSAERTSP